LYAKWEVNTYTVTFNNWDGSELQKSDWAYGSTPVYRGTAPTKADDTGYAYTFSGWDHEIVKATAAATYTAVFAKGTAGLVYALASDGKSYSVSKYTGTASDVLIPAKYNGLPVTSIGVNAFYGCVALTSVNIPDSLTSFGGYAFWGCTALASFSVGSANPNYQSIDGILLSKDGKTLVTYPAGKSGTSYDIPSSVTVIGGDAFYRCTSLASVAIPDSVTGIGVTAPSMAARP
jgi:hypothetical protein